MRLRCEDILVEPASPQSLFMDIVAALIVFSGIGAFICVKARAAAPALFFGATAVVLFCMTPLGAGLPGAAADVASWIGDQGSSVVQADAK